MQPLTYTAHLRQNVSTLKAFQRPKKESLILFHVFTMPHILHTKMLRVHGISRKEIATIGIVRAAGWVVRNRNTPVWLKVAGCWVKSTSYILSLSHAEEGR